MPFAVNLRQGVVGCCRGHHRLPQDQLGRFIDALGRNTPEGLAARAERALFQCGQRLHNLGGSVRSRQPAMKGGTARRVASDDQ